MQRHSGRLASPCAVPTKSGCPHQARLHPTSKAAMLIAADVGALRHRRGRGSQVLRTALVAAAVAALPALSRATPDSWIIGGSGNWNVGGDWSTGIPATGQD